MPLPAHFPGSLGENRFVDARNQSRHHGTMPNYSAKGVEKMRALARLGGLKSAETRRLKRAMKILAPYARERGIDLDAVLAGAEPVMRPNLSGGSHDTDWRCPYCRRFNSTKRRSCAKCGRTPANGRWTRAALRARAAEHRTQAILMNHGL